VVFEVITATWATLLSKRIAGNRKLPQGNGWISVFRFQGSPWVKKTHLSLQIPEGFSQDILLQVVAILYN
jgi:hypothetical protein